MDAAKSKGKAGTKAKGRAGAKKPSGDAPRATSGKKKDLFARFEQVKLKDMVVFSRQFSAMIGSGVAMLRTLTII